MPTVGIIAEYNPFHNGHLYHISKVKEIFPNATIILVLSGHFMQRGETSIINKWSKTKIALHHGIDLVIELPFPFATQAADIFARGSIQILDALKTDYLVFGSESNDVDKLTSLANLQINSDEYQTIVKKYLDEGLNYPTSLSKATIDITADTIDTPNDILGISYIKEIIKSNSKIQPLTIKRTNNYHDENITSNITSATSIRKSLKLNIKVDDYIPEETSKYLNEQLFFIEDYFPYLKYQILNNINDLNKFQTVDEGIENRIKRYIVEATSLDELISKIKTKRYTYNKIRRMLTHIMCNFTKEEASLFKNINYLRVLGFSDKGQTYLNKIKKSLPLSLITKFTKEHDKMLDLELRATSVYASILNEEDKTKLIVQEYRTQPIKNTTDK